MKPNFDISLPSIPGKTIKFKIQDIKQTSFGSRKQRFQDNKKGLTKKFIDSFNNFHESKDQSRLEQQTQASQTSSRISVKSNSHHEQSERKFRHMIPEDKKHIISVYEKYREYEQPILKETKFDKGYTFQKAGKDVVGEKKEVREEEEESESKWVRKFVTDNYYFTSTVFQNRPNGQEDPSETATHKKEEKNSKKRQRPSATFKNETRKRAIDRICKNEVPGPGTYIQLESKQPETRQKRSVSQKPTLKNGENDYKKLKQIITSIVGEEQEEEEDDQKQQLVKKDKMQHMFVKDDRDRFGQQKYPISFKLNVPGPGSYDIMHGIEEQAKKVSLVEEQRKLLKEWFNN